MATPANARPMRADAERSMTRILDAARIVLADDPNASLERIADEAGVARATVQRRFASRKALVEALLQQFDERYLDALKQSRVDTAPPQIALYRLTELIFELKLAHRLVLDAIDRLGTSAEHPAREVVQGVELLFGRLFATGAITTDSASWSVCVYLALISEAYHLPADAPELAAGPDDVTARTDLVVRSVLGALGGKPLGA